MRQVFLQSPWIHPEEPFELKRLIQAHGMRVELKAGTALPHGSGSSNSYVGLLEKGLGAFTFEDHAGRPFIFALIVPGRCFGDLDAMTQSRLNLKGMVIRDSIVVLIERSHWDKLVRSSNDLLYTYTKNAIKKEESHMEGMIANFTLDLSSRIRALLRSLISAYYLVKENDWNPLPVKLTITEISQIVAANRASVSLVFSDWLQQDLVRKDGRRLIIHGQLLTRIYDWVSLISEDGASVDDPF